MWSVVPEPEATPHSVSSETLLVIGMHRSRRQKSSQGDGVPGVLLGGRAASGPWREAEQRSFPLIFDYPFFSSLYLLRISRHANHLHGKIQPSSGRPWLLDCFLATGNGGCVARQCSAVMLCPWRLSHFSLSWDKQRQGTWVAKNWSIFPKFTQLMTSSLLCSFPVFLLSFSFSLEDIF